MLEVEPKEKSNDNVSGPAKKSNEQVEKSPAAPQMKVIINNEEFEKNLNHYKLKSQEKEILQQKQVIESRILRIKKEAWIKIALGILIISLAAKKYLIGDRKIKYLGNDEAELTVTTSALNANDLVLIALIIVFIYYAFLKKNKKDKK